MWTLCDNECGTVSRRWQGLAQDFQTDLPDLLRAQTTDAKFQLCIFYCLFLAQTDAGFMCWWESELSRRSKIVGKIKLSTCKINKQLILMATAAPIKRKNNISVMIEVCSLHLFSYGLCLSGRRVQKFSSNTLPHSYWHCSHLYLGTAQQNHNLLVVKMHFSSISV